MQNIVYGQYLPSVLGQETVTTYELGIDGTSIYNPDENPSITNAFATAAYRFGHSLIRSMVKLKNIFNGAEDTFRYDIRHVLKSYKGSKQIP